MSGYATDTSTGSNKRTRFDDDVVDTRPPAYRGANAKNAPLTPLEAAYSAAKASSLSLHYKMRQHILDASDEIVQAHATYFRKKEAYEMWMNDPDFIPHDARIKVTLHPVQGSENAPGFKALARKTAEVVLQCRQLLRDPILEGTHINVLHLAGNVKQAFARHLPKLAKLVAAEANRRDYDAHQLVADLMDRHGDEIKRECWLVDDNFTDIYREATGVDTIPQPSPRIVATPANPDNNNNNGQPIDLRGGFDDGSTPAPGERPNGFVRASEELRRQQLVGATPGPGGERQQPPPESTLQIRRPPPTPRDAYNAQAQQLGVPLHSQEQAEGVTFEYYSEAADEEKQNSEEEEEETTTPAPNLQAQAINAIAARSAAVLNPQQQQLLNGLPMEAQAAIFQLIIGTAAPPATHQSQGSDNNTMAEIQNINNPSQQNAATNRRGDGGGDNNNNLDVDMENGNQDNEAPPDPARDREKIIKKLLDVVYCIAIRPFQAYGKQVAENKISTEITKVAKEIASNKLADNIAEALQEEAAVDPTIVRVMIDTSVKKALDKKKRASTSENKNNQQAQGKQSSSKKARSGATGGAASKNKTPPSSTNNNRQGRGGRAGGRGGGTTSGRGRSGRSNSRKKSNKSTTTKSRKRSKSPSGSTKK